MEVMEVGQVIIEPIHSRVCSQLRVGPSIGLNKHIKVIDSDLYGHKNLLLVGRVSEPLELLTV